MRPRAAPDRVVVMFAGAPVESVERIPSLEVGLMRLANGLSGSATFVVRSSKRGAIMSGHVTRPIVFVVMLVALGSRASAQQLIANIQVSTTPNPGHLNAEPTIVASPVNPREVLVAWNGWTPGSSEPGRVRYRVSTAGFAGEALPATPSILPTPNTGGGACGGCNNPLNQSFDPVVATSRASPLTGDLFVGAFFQRSGTTDRALALGRKRLGEGDLEANVHYATRCLSNLFFDRPCLMAGRRAPETALGEALYFTFQSTDGFAYSCRSMAAAPLGSAWECNPVNVCNGYPALITSVQGDAGQISLGNPGVVIHSGARAGRLIVASCRGGAGLTSAFSPNPPEITWTDVGGGPPSCAANPWSVARVLNQYGPPPGNPVAGVNLSTSGVEIPVPTDIAFMFKSTPSIAVDPADPSNVYIAFIGRSTSDTPGEIDLFIGWTNTGNAYGPPAGDGPRFQGQDPGAPWGLSRRTHRIADSSLVAAGESTSGVHAEQFLPALVIDDFGGINVLYCQIHENVAAEPPTLYTVRYARWPNRAALEAGQPPVLLVLSPPSEPFTLLQGHEYQGITASRCWVYAAWASKHSGTWQVYVSCINLCPADADASGTLDPLDPVTFGVQFAAQQAAADVNEDGLISPQDYSDFFAAYACGACPPP